MDEGVEVGTDTTISSEPPEDPAQRLEHLLEESGGGDSWQKEDIASLRARVSDLPPYFSYPLRKIFQ